MDHHQQHHSIDDYEALVAAAAVLLVLGVVLLFPFDFVVDDDAVVLVVLDDFPLALPPVLGFRLAMGRLRFGAGGSKRFGLYPQRMASRQRILFCSASSSSSFSNSFSNNAMALHSFLICDNVMVLSIVENGDDMLLAAALFVVVIQCCCAVLGDGTRSWSLLLSSLSCAI